MKDKLLGVGQKSFSYYKKAVLAEVKLKNKPVMKMMRDLFERILLKLSVFGILLFSFMVASGVLEFWVGLLFAFLYLIFSLWLSVKLAIFKLVYKDDFRILIDSYGKDY